MNLSDSSRMAGYLQFFMKPNGGKRHQRLGQASTIDEVLLGRNVDCSGADPHQEFMQQFGDHAGVKSGHDTNRRRKPCSATADFDKLGDDADRFEQQFGSGRAGRSASAGCDRGKQSGFALSSTMDSLIWGRDFDQSGGDPHKALPFYYMTVNLG